MTINSEISKLKLNLQDSYYNIDNKDGSLPNNKSLDGLVTAINSIPNVASDKGKKYGASGNNWIGDVNNNGVLMGIDTSIQTNLVFNDIEGIGQSALEEKFYNNQTITSVSFPDLIRINSTNALNGAFNHCSNLSTVSMPELIEANGSSCLDACFFYNESLSTINLNKLARVSGNSCCYNMFYGCYNLESIDLSALTSISGVFGAAYMFSDCTNLETIDLSGLTTISGTECCENMFQGCSSLTSVSFDSLSSIEQNEDDLGIFYYTFYQCSSLESLYFPSLTAESFGESTNQFYYMLAETSNVEVHFPYDLEPILSNWDSVQNGFGGTNTKVLFDLNAAKVVFNTNPNTKTYISSEYNLFENGNAYSNNLTTVGSPTYDEKTGILTNCASNKYLKYDDTIDFDNTWECIIKIKTPASYDEYPYNESAIIGEDPYDQHGFRLQLSGTNFAFLCGDGSWINTSDYQGSYNWDFDTIYWLKCGWNKTTERYYVDYSTDGINYSNDIEYYDSRNVIEFAPKFGACSQYWGGEGITIYMSEASLKVNDVEQLNILAPISSFESYVAPGNSEYSAYFPNSGIVNYGTILNLIEKETRNVTVEEPQNSTTLTINISNAPLDLNEINLKTGNILISLTKTNNSYVINTANSNGKFLDYEINSTPTTGKTSGRILLTGSNQTETITLLSRPIENYVIVGTPTISTDYKLSNTNGSNHLLTNLYGLPSTGVEFIQKVSLPSTSPTNYNVAGGSSETYVQIGKILGRNPNRIGIYTLDTDDVTTTVSWIAGETFWMKYTETSEGINMYCIVDNNYTIQTLPNNGWTEVINDLYAGSLQLINGDYVIGCNPDPTWWNMQYWPGTIYLDTMVIRDLYTKEIYWQALIPATPEESNSQDSSDESFEPIPERVYNNFTKIGNLNVNEQTGLVSGFSSSNYLVLPEAFDPGNNPWEIQFKVHYVYSQDRQRMFNSTVDHRGLMFHSDDDSVIYVLSSGEADDDWDIFLDNLDENFLFQDDTDYIFKLAFTGTAYTVNVSTNGSAFVEILNHQESTPICSANYQFGVAEMFTEPWLGTLDLSETYIKINGQTWWVPYTETLDESESDTETVEVTFTLSGGLNEWLTHLQVDNDDYSYTDFSNDSLTILMPKDNDTHHFSCNSEMAEARFTPSSGDFYTDQDSTINILIEDRAASMN